MGAAARMPGGEELSKGRVIKAERTGNAVKIRDAERELKRLVNHCSSIARELEALGEKVTWSH